MVEMVVHRKIRVFSLAVFAFFALAPIADAATSGAVFGLRAVSSSKLGYFIYSAAPGKTVRGAVIVSNTGTTGGTVRLYGADGSTGQTTGTVYLTDKPPLRAGAWIRLATTRLTLPRGHFRRIPFTVHVPANVNPGEWVGGIVAETTQQPASGRTNRKAGVQIKVRNQTIIAVQVNVPGKQTAAFEVRSVKIGGQHGFQQLIVHLANTGNLLRKPTGKAEIVRSGKPVETLPFLMDTFLPQTSIDFPILLKTALSPGEYQARVSLTFPSSTGTPTTVSAAPSFTVSDANLKQVFTSAAPTQQPAGGVGGSAGNSTPWALIAAAAGSGLLLLLLGWWFLRRRRGRRPTYVPTVVMPLPPLSPLSLGSAPPPPAPAEPAGLAAMDSSGETDAPDLSGNDAGCDHDWEVFYDRGELSADGVWEFPHRCLTCGVELIAVDGTEASALARALAASHR